MVLAHTFIGQSLVWVQFQIKVQFLLKIYVDHKVELLHNMISWSYESGSHNSKGKKDTVVSHESHNKTYSQDLLRLVICCDECFIINHNIQV